MRSSLSERKALQRLFSGLPGIKSTSTFLRGDMVFVVQGDPIGGGQVRLPLTEIKAFKKLLQGLDGAKSTFTYLRGDMTFAISGDVDPGDPADVLWSSNWLTSATDGGFSVQEKVAGRATLVSTRNGRLGAQLHTESGDNDVSGSGAYERCDLRLSDVNSDVSQGKEAWLAHSIMFPDDFEDMPESAASPPPWYSGSVFNFHDNSDTPGSQGPAQLMMYPRTATSPDRPTGLHYEIYGGDPSSPTLLAEYPVSSIVQTYFWYDFVIHVRWSSGADGFYHCWLGGKIVFQYNGPTIYAGNGAYLKLANYHAAFGSASSVIHDRIIRGNTWESVSLTTLEGV